MPRGEHLIAAAKPIKSLNRLYIETGRLYRQCTIHKQKVLIGVLDRAINELLLTFNLPVRLPHNETEATYELKTTTKPEINPPVANYDDIPEPPDFPTETASS